MPLGRRLARTLALRASPGRRRPLSAMECLLDKIKATKSSGEFFDAMRRR